MVRDASAPGAAREGARPSAARFYRLRVGALRWLLILVFLSLWEYAAGHWVDEFIISRPTAVFKSLLEMVISGELWVHTRATLLEILIGYPIGSVVGIVTGYLLGRYRMAADVLGPIMMGLYGIPRIALAPLFIVALGIGVASKVGVVVLMTFFLTFFSTYFGMRHLDRDFINLARLMGANERILTFRVIFPSIFPQISLGLKTALPQAVIGATVGEFIASTAGLGYYIRRSASLFDSAGVFVGVVVLLVAVLAMNVGLDRLERRLMHWKAPEEEA